MNIEFYKNKAKQIKKQFKDDFKNVANIGTLNDYLNKKYKFQFVE